MNLHYSYGRFILLLLLLSVGQSAHTRKSARISDTQNIVSRTHRLLQSDEYVITQDPDVKKFCDDSGYKQSDIAITLNDEVALRAKIDGRYQDIINAAIPLINDWRSDYKPMATKLFTGTPLGVCFIFLFLTFITLAVFLVWSIFECCCQKACCVKETKAGEKRSSAKVCCFFMAVFLAVLTVAICIVWTVYLGKVVSRAPEVRCAASILYSDLIKGVNFGQNSTFAGVDGLTSILNKFDQVLTNVTTLQSKANAIQSRQNTGNTGNIKQTSNDAEFAYNSYKTAYKPQSYLYKGYSPTGAVVSTENVLPNYASVLSGLINSGLSEELNILKTVGNSIINAADGIASFSGTAVTDAKKSFADVKMALQDNIKTPFTEYYQKAFRDKDYTTQIKSAGKAYLITSEIVIIALTVVFLAILLVTASCDKCHSLKCVTKIILLIQMLFAMIILLVTILTSAVCVVIYIACWGIYGTIQEQNFITAKAGIKLSNDKFQVILSECIYKSGKGDLMMALGVDSTSMGNMNKLIDGVQQFKTLQTNLTNNPEPVLGSMIFKDITDYSTFDKEDRGQPQDIDYVSGYQKANANKCAKDVLRPNVAACAPITSISQTTDSDGAGLSTTDDFCIALARKTPSNYQNRYSSSYPCTGGVSDTDGSNILKSALDSSDSYKIKMDAMLGQYNSFYSKEQALYNALKVNSNDMTGILDGIVGAINTLDSLKGSFSKIANCLVLQKEVLILENVICYRLGDDVFAQTRIATVLGVVLYFYAWFMCCSVRLADKRKEGLKANKYTENDMANLPPVQRNDYT